MKSHLDIETVGAEARLGRKIKTNFGETKCNMHRLSKCLYGKAKTFMHKVGLQESRCVQGVRRM
jgi:hypothetical protein